MSQFVKWLLLCYFIKDINQNSLSITIHFLTLILFESVKFSDFKCTGLESYVQTV